MESLETDLFETFTQHLKAQMQMHLADASSLKNIFLMFVGMETVKV